MGRPEGNRDRSDTHAVDGEALKRFQLRKCWTNAALSFNSHVPLKTIERARKGERIELEKIDWLAEALEVESARLLLSEKPVRLYRLPTGEDVKIPINEDKRFEVTITIATPYHEFNRSEKKDAFIGLLDSVIKGSEPITINAVKEGSTLVTLEMSTQDILRLLAEMIDGTLGNMNITAMTMEDHSWIMRMIVCLKVLKTPVEPDSQTWSDMLNENMMDGIF